MSFKSLGHYGPVTALAYSGNELLVGEGPTLKRFNSTTGELLSKHKLFKRDKIHGIAVGNDSVALWGGNTLAIADLEGRPVGTQKRMNDWIISVAFAKNSPENGTWLYILTAHNAVICIDRSFRISSIITCNEQSILYSGSMLPLEGGDALVGAGTVLNGVVIWRLGTQNIVQRLTAHEGSIFGIEFSKDGEKVISCSDDRSIRLWDLETGTEEAVGWGHMGRIWQMLFLDNSSIISISEDCSARLWSVSDTTKSLVCDQKFEGHLGRNTWCGSINCDTKVLATGGGDGRIRLWDLEKHKEMNSNRVVEIWNEIPGVLKKETLKHYTLTKSGSIVGATTQNRAMYRSPSGQWVVIEGVEVDSYTSIGSWPKGDRDHSYTEAVCIASGSGNITELEITAGSSTGPKIVRRYSVSFSGRLSDLLPFDTGDGQLWYLMCTQNPKDPFLISQFGSNGEKLVTADRPITFQPLSICYDTKLNVIYMGSKHGALALFEFRPGNPDTIECVKCWRRLMSEDTITCITTANSTKKDSESRLHLTSRGGQYCSLKILYDGNDYSMEMLSMSSLAKGAVMMCRVINGDLILYGFRNELFFIWDDTAQCEIMNEKCGGAHRMWCISVDASDPYNYQFAYTKAGQLFITQGLGHTKFENTVIQQGTHGREIRAIEFSPSTLEDGSRIFASASEDTCVRICSVTETGALKTHVIQRKHVSGMQSVHWTNNGKFLLSSAANEELFVWKVTEIDSSLYAYLHAVLPTSTDVPDLRIMNFTMLELNSYQYILATVYSNSEIKLWHMDLDSCKFQMISKGLYKTCCILNCDFIVQDSATYLVISATDGHVVVYNVTDSIQGKPFPKSPLMSLGLHQSSVKASFIKKIPESSNEYLHLSGGDDNALVSSLITIENDNNVYGRKICQVTDAHIATITSVGEVSKGYVTASVDQDVKLWEVSEDYKIYNLSCDYTTVADTGAMDSCRLSSGEFMTCFGGSGLSFWSSQ